MSNGNVSGNNEDRKRRRQWLLETYRADVDVYIPDDGRLLAIGHAVPVGEGIATCRCYWCGTLLTIDTVTVDRIIPGCKGGTYRRNNIRPACKPCNDSTGGKLGASRVKRG